MGKYIWPSDIAAASRWYLMLLKEIARGVTFDEFIELLGTDPPKDTAQREESERAIRSRLSRMAKAGLVQKTGQRRSLQFKVTSQGLKQLAMLEFLELKPPPNYHWDRSWRIVIFDVPEALRGARNDIRRLLKELGFMQLQLSVWIHPLPCFDKFEQLKRIYGTSENILLLETRDFFPPQRIVSHFQKIYPQFVL